MTKKLSSAASTAAQSATEQQPSMSILFKAPAAKRAAVRTDDESELSLNNLTAEYEQTESCFEQTAGGTILTGRSKKKQQYLEQEIVDRSGAYNYAEDPTSYKKARK